MSLFCRRALPCFAVSLLFATQASADDAGDKAAAAFLDAVAAEGTTQKEIDELGAKLEASSDPFGSFVRVALKRPDLDENAALFAPVAWPHLKKSVKGKTAELAALIRDAKDSVSQMGSILAGTCKVVPDVAGALIEQFDREVPGDEAAQAFFACPDDGTAKLLLAEVSKPGRRGELACGAVFTMPAPAARKFLRETLIDAKAPLARRRAASARLMDQDTEEDFAVEDKLLESGDGPLVSQALAALRSRRHAAPLDALKPLLKPFGPENAPVDLSKEAQAVLAISGDPDAAAWCVRSAIEDMEREDRREWLRCAGFSRVPAVLKDLRDREEKETIAEQRTYLLEALAESGETWVKDLLGKRLSGTSDESWAAVKGAVAFVERKPGELDGFLALLTSAPEESRGGNLAEFCGELRISTRLKDHREIFLALTRSLDAAGKNAGLRSDLSGLLTNWARVPAGSSAGWSGKDWRDWLEKHRELFLPDN